MCFFSLSVVNLVPNKVCREILKVAKEIRGIVTGMAVGRR